MSAFSKRIKSIQRAHKKRTGKALSYKRAVSKYKAAKKFVDKELKSKPRTEAGKRKKMWLKIEAKKILSGKISTKKRRHVLNLIADLSEMSEGEIDGIIATYPNPKDSGVYKFMEWAKKKGIF